jgi:hypothetical protein
VSGKHLPTCSWIAQVVLHDAHPHARELRAREHGRPVHKRTQGLLRGPLLSSVRRGTAFAHHSLRSCVCVVRVWCV